MLSLPSTHLVIINRSDTGGRIKRFLNSIGKWNQVSFVMGKNLTDLTTLIEYLLPKPALDTVSIRRNELLERRLQARPTEVTNGKSDLEGEN